MLFLVFLFLLRFGWLVDIGDFYGYGYSSDSQRIGSPCFASYVVKKNDQETTFALEEAFSYKDLQQSLHTSVQAGAGIGIFDITGKFSYLRQVEDKDYTLSLSYYVASSQKVEVALQGEGLDALDKASIEKFNSTDAKKYFGVACGDHYISEYQQGAILVISLDIHFKSHLDKKVWTAESGIGLFWNIIKLSGMIQIAATKLNIDGEVSIKAYQYGGNVTMLPSMLKKDEKTGIYYALKCSLLDMDDCIKSSQTILDYAINEFPKQYSFEDQRGLANLDVGYLKVNPIEYIGLSPPESLVTDDVKTTRDYLEKSLFKNKYYVEKTTNLLNAYPVDWNTTGTVYTSAVALLNTAKENVDILLQHDRPDQGPLVCYLHPTNCIEENEKIKYQVKIISDTDLDDFIKIQYFFPFFAGSFYPTGGKDTSLSWTAPLSDTKFPMINHVFYVQFNTTFAEWEIEYVLKDGQPSINGKWKGVSNDGINYVGKLVLPTGEENLVITREENPFYFEKFEPTINSEEETYFNPKIEYNVPRRIGEEKTVKSAGANSYGWGYSADTQQGSHDICYNTVESKSSNGQSSFLQLNEAISFTDIERTFQISIKKKIGFWIFSVTVISTYLRKIEDTDYTLSLNYYSYSSETVSLDVLGAGEGILTSGGLEKYKDPTSHKNFGMICGDYIVTDYEIGTMLTMSIHLEFQSHYDKRLFGIALKLGFFGNLFHATLKIQLIISKLKTKGRLTVHALQIGGNVTEIGHILPDSQGEGHYSITCDLGTLDSCQKAASEVLDYAVVKFPEQYSFETRKGVVELGISKQKAIPIEYFGLQPPDSLVSKEVENARDMLSTMLWENKYYMDNFYQLAYYYPVEFNDSSIVKRAIELYSQAKSNYDRLFHQNTTEKGAAQCFYNPAECVSVSKDILNEIKPITTKDLEFMIDLKYFMPIFSGSFWPTGGAPRSTSWDFLPGFDPFVGRISKIYTIQINPTRALWDIDFIITDPQQRESTHRGSWEGSSEDGVFYYGTFTCDSKTEPMFITMGVSPLFFKPYSE